MNEALKGLLSYCESQGFKGWDPYDGLNSRVFKALGLNNVSFLRLAWIQLFKRSPFNIRGLLLVPKGHNPKGIGLFLSAYSKELKYLKECGSNDLISKEKMVKELADLLIELRSNGY